MWFYRLISLLRTRNPFGGAACGSAAVRTLLWSIGLVVPAELSASDRVYTVGGVAVDVTAESVTQARATAIAEGHQKALNRLFRRIVLEADLSRVPRRSGPEIEALVRDFSVSDERSSDVRYLADMTFRFKPAAIRGLLRQQAIRFAETQSKPMLVLPIVESESSALLWQDPNPWRDAWARRPSGSNLVPLIAPIGDLADVAAIDAGKAAAGDAVALGAISRRYGDAKVLISRARLEGDLAAGSGKARISNRRFAAGKVADIGATTYAQTAGEDAAGFLARVTEAVALQVQRSWKERNVLEFGTKGQLQVTVPFGSFKEWLAVKKRLAGLPSIESAILANLTRNKAELELAYFGSEAQLTTALAQRSLVLSKGLSDSWQLRLDAAVSALSTQ